MGAPRAAQAEGARAAQARVVKKMPQDALARLDDELRPHRGRDAGRAPLGDDGAERVAQLGHRVARRRDEPAADLVVGRVRRPRELARQRGGRADERGARPDLLR